MKISSPIFSNNQAIPPKYTCEGNNVNPPLIINGINNKTMELALLVVDPDAPSKDFVHWILYGINPSVNIIREAQTPPNTFEGKNDFGLKGYKGPCPPQGKHRYKFHLYALKEKLSFNGFPNKNDFRNALKNKVIEEAVLIGTYEKKNP